MTIAITMMDGDEYDDSKLKRKTDDDDDNRK